ncbi:hypothetical protein SBRCBS47491_000712 [Sporothrix bragantina]|uniref:Uncharacterized protein n=1 Tax=Sporothrix bragantina TaxID=671064 RepID=A0ABP0ASP5_9PEZI
MTIFDALPPVQQRERSGSAIAVDSDVEEATPLNKSPAQQRQATPQADGSTSTGIPLQVAQLHLRLHENFQKEKGRRRRRNANPDTNVPAPWPKRWLGSRQWRQHQGRGAGLWESSFDGPSATAGSSLTGAYTTSVTHKVSDNVTCVHQLVLTANSTGAASVNGGATTGSSTTAAAAATASNKAVGSWATKKDGRRAKLVGNMANAPTTLMWLLNPRETLFQWAQAKSNDPERLKRKKQKKGRRQRKKEAKNLKALGLPPVPEEDEELAQQLQNALVGPAPTTEGEPTAASAKAKGKKKGKDKETSGDNGAQTVTPPDQGASTAAASSPDPAKPSVSIHEAVVATSSATGHRLVTQYGRIWVPHQTPHGEEESIAAAGDGAVSVMEVDEHGGTVAPPNSVAGSGYGRLFGTSLGSDYCLFQSSLGAIVMSAADLYPNLKRSREISEVSEDDNRSFVTCCSRL